MSDNTRTAAIKPWHYLGLSPLLIAPLSLSDSIVFAGIYCCTAIAVAATLFALRRWITDTQRWLVSALVIAVCVTSFDLLTQALSYSHYQGFGVPLLLIAGSCVLFAEADTALRAEKFSAVLRGTALRSAILAATSILLTALCQWLPRAAAPALFFIIASTVIAACNWFLSRKNSRPAPIDMNTDSIAARRVRVTGPVR